MMRMDLYTMYLPRLARWEAELAVDDLARQFNCDADLVKYCAIGVEIGATHAKQVNSSSVVTAPWVRLKCQYGCPGYGHGHCCPPYTSTPEQTRAVLDSYHRAILFHIEVPHMPHKEKHYKKYFDKLVDLEGEIFKDGFYKAPFYISPAPAGCAGLAP